ncbi:MAG: Na(+)/H(+) antiporter subunit A [Sphingobacteriaceae bacterium]|nr:Na(+)/H(+) antiporter subunit A [Sphingobacteriaceae bacterium]
MLSVLCACVIAALGLPVLVPRLPAAWRPSLAILPLGSFVYFLLTPISESQLLLTELPPVHLWLKLDGLSRLFALLITGIGTLVYAYSGYYLKNHEGQGRFYGFISLFMGAMLGLVLANDLYFLFICWELTSISSFFLIGLNQQEAKARSAALQALTVTGLGGLALLGGAVILQIHTGTTQIDALAARMPADFSVGITAALLLVWAAAFTKSAQFPFHFWLPGAMAAPTPISTYLHSATMVKAGVYLLFRLSAAFAAHPWWTPVLTTVGAVTMLYAALHALFRHDMKSILAYTTIAALGILVFFIGWASPLSMQAALLFVLVHALYKAALFLITGAVDHATHTRNVLRLHGLRKQLPALAVAGGLAALLNGGFPPFLGFIGKDLMYEALLHEHAVIGVPLLLVVNVALLYAGLQVGYRPFAGSAMPEGEVSKVSFWLWLPPLLLAVLGLLFGFLPQMPNALIAAAHVAVGSSGFAPLQLWHGFNEVLAWSLATLLAGVLFFRFWPMNRERLGWTEKVEMFSPAALFTWLASSLQLFARRYTSFFQHGYLRYYVMTVVAVLIGGISLLLFDDFAFKGSFEPLLELTFYELGTLAMLLAGLVFVVFTPSRLAAVAGLGVMGFAICLLFVFYSAPDLAITQFAIDTLTVILFVLVLYKLPRYIRVSSMAVVLRDGVVSLVFGGLIALLALQVIHQPLQRSVSTFYAAQSYVAAKGKNVVNVILVDFRGADTLVEITVLSIAALGVYGLLKLRLRAEERRNRA